jgi:hypothetical protein
MPLLPSNVSFFLDENIYWSDGEISTYETGYIITGSTSLEVSRKLKNIKIAYARLPIWHDFSDLSKELDIPEDMAGILEFFVMRRLMPVHLEQWASLANNYFNQATASLEMYAKNIWLLSQQTGFTA